MRDMRHKGARARAPAADAVVRRLHALRLQRQALEQREFDGRVLRHRKAILAQPPRKRGGAYVRVRRSGLRLRSRRRRRQRRPCGGGRVVLTRLVRAWRLRGCWTGPSVGGGA
jgi:hypothetical protein